MFKHMLVPLDGSFRAEAALPVAARIARASDGSIVFMQVVNPPVDYAGGLATGTSLLAGQMIETEMTQAMDYLKSVAASPALAGMQISTEVMVGSPAVDIMAVAESRAIDLIVLCSHGRTGISRWVLGSVAHRLVHQSAVPVLVLQTTESAAPPFAELDTQRLFRVLVPLDGSPHAEAALLPAVQLVSALATPGYGALRLVQVVKAFPSTAAEGFVSELNEETLSRAKSYLTKVQAHLLETFKDLKLTITWSVTIEADTAEALVGIAEHDTDARGGSNLIAISTHGRGAVERWVMGSVTERVLNITKLPMLIVRPKKVEQE